MTTICVALLALLAATRLLGAAEATAPVWPASSEALVFAYESRNRVLAFGPDGQPLQSYTTCPGDLQPKGAVFIDRHEALELRGGFYEAMQTGPFLTQSLRRANALSVEFCITPRTATQNGVILFLGASAQSGHLVLRQQGKELALQAQTTPEANEGATIPLFALPDTSSRHVAVVCAGGKLAIYWNGKLAAPAVSLPLDFAGWEECRFTLGALPSAEEPWNGTLEGVALYARALSAAEIERNARVWLDRIRQRPPVPPLKVRAKLVARSDTPHNVQPYYRVLSIYQYDVEQVLSGECKSKAILVAHWCMVDHNVLPFAKAPVGRNYELLLEPFDAHPQLESEYQSEMLSDETLELPRYYDAGGLSLEYKENHP